MPVPRRELAGLEDVGGEVGPGLQEDADEHRRRPPPQPTSRCSSRSAGRALTRAYRQEAGRDEASGATRGHGRRRNATWAWGRSGRRARHRQRGLRAAGGRGFVSARPELPCHRRSVDKPAAPKLVAAGVREMRERIEE